MLGEFVTSSHMRVPVASNPKYFSVSRFKSTLSPSRCLTSTCGGTTTRSESVTISSAPGLPGSATNPIPLLLPRDYLTGDYLSLPRALFQRGRFPHCFLYKDTL